MRVRHRTLIQAEHRQQRRIGQHRGAHAADKRRAARRHLVAAEAYPKSLLHGVDAAAPVQRAAGHVAGLLLHAVTQTQCAQAFDVGWIGAVARGKVGAARRRQGQDQRSPTPQYQGHIQRQIRRCRAKTAQRGGQDPARCRGARWWLAHDASSTWPEAADAAEHAPRRVSDE